VKIIDSQVHAYEANTPSRPWDSIPNWPDHVTGTEMVAAMDSVGVDGAILVSAFSLYGYDASYAVEVRNSFPERFGLVKPVDPSDPAIGEVIAAWKQTPGAVGIRIMMTAEPLSPSQWMGDHSDPGLDLVLREAVRHNFPVNLLCWDNLDAGIALIDCHPEVRFILDHVGILQPRTPPAPTKPWTQLPKVLGLASRPNVVIKISGACTLSNLSYPFSDIWDPLARVFDAWGLDRCLWGTDWTRAFAVVNYQEAVAPFRLTDQLEEGERAMLMGGACAEAYGWKPGNH
jgi:L-fuconolactonase